MRTSFRAALTDWKCVVQKSGCSTMIEAPCFNEAYKICVHAVLETLATYEMEQAKRTRPSKQDQASCSKWKDAGCFLAKQQPLPCIFFAQKPPRTICLQNVSGRNNEPASADPTKHLNANRNAKQKRQRKSRARAQGASHIGIPKHP